MEATDRPPESLSPAPTLCRQCPFVAASSCRADTCRTPLCSDCTEDERGFCEDCAPDAERHLAARTRVVPSLPVLPTCADCDEPSVWVQCRTCPAYLCDEHAAVSRQCGACGDAEDQAELDGEFDREDWAEEGR